MGLTLTATAGLIFWVVMWSLGVNPTAAFLLTLLIAVCGGGGKILLNHVGPGRDRR